MRLKVCKEGSTKNNPGRSRARYSGSCESRSSHAAERGPVLKVPARAPRRSRCFHEAGIRDDGR
eukprot:9927222-Lingulodinium_polyedra.AAC.1